MKKSLLTAALVTAFSTGSAFAADLPSTKAPILPPPSPAPLWTGFYVGLNAGGAWTENNRVDTSAWSFFNNGFPGSIEAAPLSAALANTSLGVNNGGFIGGGQIGYNYQFRDRFVAGVEADIQGIAGSRNSVTAISLGNTTINGPLAQIATASKSLDYLGTVRGRLGYLITPTLLGYATGGLAYGGVNVSAGITQIFTVNPLGSVGNPYFSAGSFSDTRVGWTVGGGLEWMFLPNWSAKVEYLYYDLGTVYFAQSPLVNRLPSSALFTAAQPASSTRFDGHVVRAGVNYHFNLFGAPAAVVAKY